MLQEADLPASVAALACSDVTARLQPTGPRIFLSGLIGAGAPRAALDAMTSRFTRAGVLQGSVMTFPASPQYCRAADIARSAHSVKPDGAIKLSLQGEHTRLLTSDPIVLSLRMPDFGGEVRVDYLTDGGATAVHAEPTSGMPTRHPANSAVPIGPKGDGNIGTVSEPYGIDMIMAVASSLPLFAAPRSNPETADAYLSDLAAAIDEVRRQGGQVSIGLLVLETVSK